MKQILLIAVLIILITVVECVETDKSDANEQERWGYSASTVKSRLLKKSFATNQTQSTQENQQNNIQENKLENEQENNQQNNVQNEQEAKELIQPINNIIEDIREGINTAQDYLGNIPLQQDNQNCQLNDSSLQDNNQANQVVQLNDKKLEDINTNKLENTNQLDQDYQTNNNRNLQNTNQVNQNVQSNGAKNLEDVDKVFDDTDYSQNNNEFVQPIVVIFENLRQDIEKIESYFADLKTNQKDQKDYANDAKALEIIDIVFQDTSYGQELEYFGQSFQQLLINIGNVHNQFEQYINETQNIKVKLEDLNARLGIEMNQEKTEADQFVQIELE